MYDVRYLPQIIIAILYDFFHLHDTSNSEICNENQYLWRIDDQESFQHYLLYIGFETRSMLSVTSPILER